ncbi:deleted in malignant brain tumors 1 protein-like [Silurus meridionalis]|nr:deleted in malignant brain tumors 1 protein-like [Silurus meridionalis]
MDKLRIIFKTLQSRKSTDESETWIHNLLPPQDLSSLQDMEEEQHSDSDLQKQSLCWHTITFPKTEVTNFSVFRTVNLLQPNISFSAASGSFHWGSDGPDVTRGYSFSIICSTKPQYPGGCFHLKFSGSNITRTQSAVNHSAIFLFPEADFVHHGNYSCTYEINVSSRTFTSTANEVLVITVKVNQVGGANNTYESPQGKPETDDNEDIYQNAENIFQQQEEDSEDSDDDYMNVDPDEQKRDVGNDYVDTDIYANCVG